MRKGIKILRKVCFTVLLLVVFLPLSLSIGLHIPFVQHFAVSQFSRIASDFLETKVSVGELRVNMWGKLSLEQFYVEDYQHDTLLYVDRCDAFVTGLGIFGGGLQFHRAKMDGAKLFLKETADSVMNIKQVVMRLSNPNKKKKRPFHLSITKAMVNDMELRIERLQHRNPSFGVDYGNMRMTDMRAFVDNLTINGPEISTLIHTFRAREQSGFQLEHLSGQFFLTGGKIHFEDALLVTSKSYVPIPDLWLRGDSWAEYKDFIQNVEIEGVFEHAHLSTDDVGYFAPRLKDWRIGVSDAHVEFRGTVDNFAAKVRNLCLNNDTFVTAEAMVKGLPQIKRTHFDIRLQKLNTTASNADSLAGSISRRVLPEMVVKTLDEAGRVEVKGRFRGKLSAFVMDATASTPIGGARGNLKMEPLPKGLSNIKGEVAVEDLLLGRFVNMADRLKETSVQAKIDGIVGRQYTDAKIVGKVSKLVFNNYSYDSLRFDGRVMNRQFNGFVKSRDQHLDFDFEGLIDHNGTAPRYDFELALREADLRALNINHRDSVSVLSARLTAKGMGRTLDDVNGRILLTDGRYRYNAQEVMADTVMIRGENDQNHKFVELKSDFMDATFESRISYRDVFSFLKRSARKYIPTLTPYTPNEEELIVIPKGSNDYSSLRVNVRDFNPIADAIAPGLQVAEGSSLRFKFNPVSNRLSFQASSDYVERQKFLATRLHVNASNRGDSLSLYASAEDLYAGAIHMPHFSTTGGARRGEVQLVTAFNDMKRKFAGKIGVRAGVADEHGEHGRTVELRILQPSYVSLNDREWQISAHRILLDTAQVSINKFYMMNSRQDLFIDGVASRHAEDSVVLRLRNFDMAPFSQITDRLGYSVDGVTNGEAVMKSMLGKGEISADIRVDSLSVNGMQGPPLHLSSKWDMKLNRAGVTVTDRIRRDTLARGFYVPNTKRYYAKVMVDSLDMGLLDPLLSSVISETKGTAQARLILQGQRREAELSGEVLVKNARTKINFTQVTYRIPEGRLLVNGSRFKGRNITVYDKKDNQGKMDIDLDLSHLSNIAYDIKVRPNKMLVLNTTDNDNDYFYGTVYATGNARIRGTKGNVDMDITATSDDNSSFFMPLSSKTNISDANFVTFRTPDEKKAEKDDLEQKKQAFERRHRKNAGAVNQMNINLALNVKPNVDLELTVAGNTLKGRGEGNLNMQINPRSNIFEMYGDYVISEGSFLFSLQKILNRKFIIEPGSIIRWTGSPINAALDIEAIHKVKASLQPLLEGSSDKMAADRSMNVECVINLKDRLTNPTVEFDVRVPSTDPEMQAVVANALNTPETVDMQFLYLLLFKSFMAENNSASQNFGSSMPYNTGLKFLTNQLSNLFSTSGYDILISYRPKSELTSDEVDFGMSKSLINNRLFVEVEGNYLLDNRQAVNSNSMSSFMGEAYITYLIDRAGALKLKAFTQTIDRFDENQGLQETGVGIYFKEDFNNFRDFRQRIKERFTNKKRREAREARREKRRSQKQMTRGVMYLMEDDARLKDAPTTEEDNDNEGFVSMKQQSVQRLKAQEAEKDKNNK